MAEDQAGPAGQEDNGEGKPGDEYRFAAGPAEADAAVFDGRDRGRARRGVRHHRQRRQLADLRGDPVPARRPRWR